MSKNHRPSPAAPVVQQPPPPNPSAPVTEVKKPEPIDDLVAACAPLLHKAIDYGGEKEGGIPCFGVMKDYKRKPFHADEEATKRIEAWKAMASVAAWSVVAIVGSWVNDLTLNMASSTAALVIEYANVMTTSTEDDRTQKIAKMTPFFMLVQIAAIIPTGLVIAQSALLADRNLALQILCTVFVGVYLIIVFLVGVKVRTEVASVEGHKRWIASNHERELNKDEKREYETPMPKEWCFWRGLRVIVRAVVSMTECVFGCMPTETVSQQLANYEEKRKEEEEKKKRKLRLNKGKAEDRQSGTAKNAQEDEDIRTTKIHAAVERDEKEKSAIANFFVNFQTQITTWLTWAIGLIFIAIAQSLDDPSSVGVYNAKVAVAPSERSTSIVVLYSLGISASLTSIKAYRAAEEKGKQNTIVESISHIFDLTATVAPILIDLAFNGKDHHTWEERVLQIAAWVLWSVCTATSVLGLFLPYFTEQSLETYLPENFWEDQGFKEGQARAAKGERRRIGVPANRTTQMAPRFSSNATSSRIGTVVHVPMSMSLVFPDGSVSLPFMPPSSMAALSGF